MSGIINKVKDAVTGGHHEKKDHSEHTAGPHNTDTENRLDPRVDSDNSKHHGGLGTTNTGYGSNTSTGTGGAYGTSHHSTNAGPHDNNAANILDPRVDSDRDGSRTYGNTAGTHGTHGTSNIGSTGTHGHTGTSGYGTSTNAGPHDSNIANKLDPRVDSDRDGSRTAGGAGYGGSTGTGYGYQGTTGGIHGSDTAGSYGGSTTTPHSSGIANKLDPRVDTTSGQHHHGSATGFGGPGSEFGTRPGETGRFDDYTSTGSHNTGVTGGHHQHQPNHPVGGTGITGSGAGYDNTTSHTGTGVGHSGSGYEGAGHTGSSNTTGPHSSSLLNKLDPRVDSDRDGSKTVGGNQQYGGSSNTGTGPYAHKDTHDAAQVPPSAFQSNDGTSSYGSKQGGSVV